MTNENLPEPKKEVTTGISNNTMRKGEINTSSASNPNVPKVAPHQNLSSQPKTMHAGFYPVTKVPRLTQSGEFVPAINIGNPTPKTDITPTTSTSTPPPEIKNNPEKP